MSCRDFVPVIGLVGGIGSGKSALAGRFAADRRVAVVDGDRVGHEILGHSSVKEAIRQRFGDAVFDDRGEIDRRALAGRVFGEDAGHRDARSDLERIVHPHIRKTFVERIAEAGASGAVEAVLLDAAVLLEAGWNDLCTAVVYVDVPRDVRLRRVIDARGWSEQEFRTREASQAPTELKRNASDFIVENSGDLHDAVVQLEQVVNQILARR